MERRVVVTGMGALTPIGNNVNEFWDNSKRGLCGIDFITKFDTTDVKTKIAAEIKNFNPESFMEKKELRRMDDFSIYALAAAREAVYMSGIDLNHIDCYRFGVIVGSGIGGLYTMEEQILKMGEKGPQRISPLFIPMSISNMAAGNIAIKYNARGICSCVVTACASASNSIGEAYRHIARGTLDLCLAGGTEAPIVKAGMAGFNSLTALSESDDPKRASIPFDKERNGFVMGEGAGILMLEALDTAQKRGANILGEVVGYGATCDAYHMTAPAPDGCGAAYAIEAAVKDAKIDVTEVGYINAHGTSTPHNDKAETLAIKKVFSDYAYKIPVSSSKSMIGHLLGAAGGLEAISALKALEEGILPPTIGYREKDEECDLDYVPGEARKASIQYALSNSFGFGGHNAVLAFKKWEGK